MIKTPSEAPAASASATDAMANAGLIPQLQMMYQALWASPVRNSLFMLAGSLFIVIAATAYGQILLNEINTMPGMTAASYFPKMWAASGLPLADLLDRLITTALRKQPGLH